MGQWESISAFISMGGYGQYVWGSYGMVLFCFLHFRGFVLKKTKMKDLKIVCFGRKQGSGRI